MDVLRATNEPDTGHSKSVRINGILGRLRNPRMIGQPQVVVGTEVEDLAAPRLDIHTLGIVNDPFYLESARLFRFRQDGATDLFEGRKRFVVSS